MSEDVGCDTSSMSSSTSRESGAMEEVTVQRTTIAIGAHKVPIICQHLTYITFKLHTKRQFGDMQVLD